MTMAHQEFQIQFRKGKQMLQVFGTNPFPEMLFTVRPSCQADQAVQDLAKSARLIRNLLNLEQYFLLLSLVEKDKNFAWICLSVIKKEEHPDAEYYEAIQLTPIKNRKMTQIHQFVHY